ncbi:MAG TPA: quaternary ammonium compound efflux SMR transporter SugE [Candidatus Sumerlaeota bacterium]|nr:quaternary ammonium compound efflux SMR transporter SugE [Candidatus Sumerlaeota bacterium]HOR28472.1 quaternary ammonium compound efflux SMR transporter SugE [Candidatus Sumerlaeota bacterium]
MTAWGWLVIAGLMEVVWAVGLKYTDGFRRPGPTALTLAAMAISFYLLAVAVRTLPVGTAYAVWTGIGVLGTALVGVAALGEPATAARLGCLALIVGGIVGLRLTAW